MRERSGETFFYFYLFRLNVFGLFTVLTLSLFIVVYFLWFFLYDSPQKDTSDPFPTTSVIYSSTQFLSVSIIICKRSLLIDDNFFTYPSMVTTQHSPLHGLCPYFLTSFYMVLRWAYVVSNWLLVLLAVVENVYIPSSIFLPEILLMSNHLTCIRNLFQLLT